MSFNVSPGVTVIEVDWDPTCFKGITMHAWMVVLRYMHEDNTTFEEVRQYYLDNKEAIDKDMERNEFQFAVLPGETEKQANERFSNVKKAAEKERYDRYYERKLNAASSQE